MKQRKQMSKPLRFFFLVLLLAACQRQPEVGVACDELAGSLEVLHLEREDIGHGYPYTINVYLPPCYEVETERAYPILYLFPGRSSNPSTWFEAGAGEVADRLIVDKHIPPLIIVGLENVEGDLDGDNFADNIYPYVESYYRTLQGARYHAVGGGSMGGAPSYRLALRYPERFGSAGLFGSGIILGEEERVRAWLGDLPPAKRPRVFLNTGLQDADLITRARELESIFLEYGVQPETIFTDGGHAYSYWVSSFDEYLKWLAAGWMLVN